MCVDLIEGVELVEGVDVHVHLIEVVHGVTKIENSSLIT
jgi:hypothetical protein